MMVYCFDDSLKTTTTQKETAHYNRLQLQQLFMQCFGFFAIIPLRFQILKHKELFIIP